jgi:hypothetical protein
MKYVRIEQGLLGFSAGETVTEADATHVAVSVLRAERAAADQRVRQAQQGAERERAERGKLLTGLHEAQQEIAKLRASNGSLIREKRNWRRRAMAGIGSTEQEEVQRYVCDRHGQWYRVLVLVLDVEAADSYADLALAVAGATATELRGSPARVWRDQGIWYVEVRVPVRST